MQKAGLRIKAREECTKYSKVGKEEEMFNKDEGVGR